MDLLILCFYSYLVVLLIFCLHNWSHGSIGISTALGGNGASFFSSSLSIYTSVCLPFSLTVSIDAENLKDFIHCLLGWTIDPYDCEIANELFAASKAMAWKKMLAVLHV